MERLTSNKKVSDMSMIELAHNSCYADDERNARYRDYEMDMDARDFARNLMVTLAKDEMPISDTEFDEEILDDLAIDPFSDVRGLIALFYRNLWAMANLRETLKNYEDLGYTPEELKVCFVDVPEALYAIDNNRKEDEKVYPIYPVDGQQIEYDKSGIYWNCKDDYGDYVTLPLSGLHYDYFVDRDEAESSLKELRGGKDGERS